MEYAGLDLHKSFCQIKICTKEGELIKEGRIKTELRRRNLKYQDGAGIFMVKGKKWLCNLKNPAIDSYRAIYEAVDRELKNAEREIEKAFSYAGLVPRVHQSGNTSYYGRITKEGSKYLRWILVEAVRTNLNVLI